jgi:AraC-like DNA-binding protein
MEARINQELRKRGAPGLAAKDKAVRNGEEPEFFSRQIAEARRFFLRLSPPWPESFNVVCGGIERCSSDYHTTRVDFPYLAIEFVARGEGALVINGKSHPLMTGAVFAYGPGIAHDIRSRPDKPMTKYFVNFAGSQALKRMVRPGPRPGEIVQSAVPEHLAELFESMIDAGKRETPFRERICRVIGDHLLLRIAETAVPLGTIGTVAFETFQKCRQWVDWHYQQLESLEEIASACGVDPTYVCRLFKRYAHHSPWQYVLRLKMRDAAQRLQARDVRVGEVALQCGFEDPFQFSRTFRRVFGISPKKFVQFQHRGRRDSAGLRS